MKIKLAEWIGWIAVLLVWGFFGWLLLRF